MRIYQWYYGMILKRLGSYEFIDTFKDKENSEEDKKDRDIAEKIVLLPVK